MGLVALKVGSSYGHAGRLAGDDVRNPQNRTFDTDRKIHDVLPYFIELFSRVWFKLQMRFRSCPYLQSRLPSTPLSFYCCLLACPAMILVAGSEGTPHIRSLRGSCHCFKGATRNTAITYLAPVKFIRANYAARTTTLRAPRRFLPLSNSCHEQDAKTNGSYVRQLI
nr:hypothetical protein CFP56_43789 [Quercus suber]